jgi:hypothetical protein
VVLGGEKGFEGELWFKGERRSLRESCGLRGRAVVSHISRKTSEMWGTRLWLGDRDLKAWLLVEHYGYFVGGEALGWVAGAAGTYGGFVVLAGGDFLVQDSRQMA